MNGESSNNNLHSTVQKLHSQIELLEKLYVVLSGMYAISLGKADVREMMISTTESISAQFKELERIKGSQKELEALKAKYNLMAKRWESVIKEKENTNGSLTKKVRRIFAKYR